MNHQAPCAAGHLQWAFEPKVFGSACGLFPRPWILKTDAKAPTWSLPWTGMRVGIFMVEFLVKSIRIRPFRREQLHPLEFFKLVTHKEGIVLCLHPLFNVTPIQGVNRCSCSHPQNARLPISLSSVGMTTSCSATQFRKTSLPICVSRGGSHPV